MATTYSVYGDILGAIYAKYAASSALYSLTADATSMYFSEAPPGALMPYIVVDIIDIVPIYVFEAPGTPMEEVRVSFFVADQAADLTAISNIFNIIDALYGINGSALTFSSSTYSRISSDKVMFLGFDRLDGVWSATADYILHLQKL